MIKSGPKIINDGVVFCVDTASNRSIGKAGCMGFNSAPQLIKNLANTGQTISSTSALRLSNLTFYTIYGITYPEGNYSPASRDGITPGFNDTSSSKLLDFSRDLNYAVWDNATNSWVADSYFNGERLAGHCYDTYDTAGNAATEHVQFQNDHAAIKSAYPDATHIVVGSHAAENNDSDANTLAILKDLGGASSWPTDRAEYVLIGKPGLGPDNAYVWQYQNDSANVAHANVGLPIVGGKGAGGNYFEFDGSNDYITVSHDTSFDNTTFSFSAWVYVEGSTSTDRKVAHLSRTSEGGGRAVWQLRTSATVNEFLYQTNNGGTWQTQTYSSFFSGAGWYHICLTHVQGSAAKIYRNGVEIAGSGSCTQNFSFGTDPFYIGCRNNGSIASPSFIDLWDGRMAQLILYNKELTAAQVLRNYNATKTRFL
jgi:hypothetical protein